jgi:hypothetical protein
MPSLYCDHCGYRIHVRAAELWLENCPRCAVRNKTLVPLAVSPAVAWDADADSVGDAHLQQSSEHLSEHGFRAVG